MAITVAALAVAVFGLESRGVRVVGAIPRSLPPLTWTSLASLPDFDMIRKMGMGAMAVAALGLVEAVASGQALARRSGDRIDSNQEFFGQGLANLASGLFSGYPCSGSFTRSAVAQQVGGRTALTGIITGITVLLGMLMFAPYARYIPRAAIAAVLLAIAWGMLERHQILRVFKTSRTEGAIMAVTFPRNPGATARFRDPRRDPLLAGVLRHSLQPAPGLPGCSRSPFRHLVHSPKAPVCPQLGVMNIRGPLFFGAVHHIEEELRHNLEDNPGQHLLMLRMHGVDIIDLSGIEMLESTVNTYRSFGGDVYLVRLREPVEQVMRDSGFLDFIGLDHVLPQEGAIEHLFEEVLDPAVCTYECELRVFAECQALRKHPYRAQVPPIERVSLDPAHIIDVDEFRAMADDPNALVLDIREPDEFVRGHIPGARLMPLRTVLDVGPGLARDRRLLLACRSGRRTQRAMQMLLTMGFEDVFGLRGGILAWRAEGLPVAMEEASAPAKDSDPSP